MVALDKILKRLLAAMLDILQGSWILTEWRRTLKIAHEINDKINEVSNTIGW